MKLRLPSILLSALVAAQMCTTANADTVVASGVSYDVGKASPSYSGTNTGLTEDYLHCWATSASNVIQNWQDKYSGNAKTGVDLPDGTVTKPAGSADGTANLEVYKTILDNSYGKLPDGTVAADGKGSNGGTAEEAFDWWFKNVGDSKNVLKESRQDGDYYEIFNGLNTTETVKADPDSANWGLSLDFTDAKLKDIFATAGGNGVTLEIHQTSTTELGTGGCRSHSITCWGYETDNEGNISALFLSDSDDLAYGVFKAQAQHGPAFDSTLDAQWGDYGLKNTTSLHMSTDDYHDGFNGDFEVFVQNASTIATPAAATLNDGASDKAETGIAASGKVSNNTVLSTDQTISGKGVVVGTDNENTLVMLTAENGTKVSLDGAGATESGLYVEKGSLASLNNVEISNYNGSGVELEGRGYLHDGKVSITNNKADNGGAAKTSTYLEIEGNSQVAISGNSATDKGGAIYNAKGGTVSIFGNDSVEFSNNTASKNGGQDIYNAEGGIVNIYNNDKVEFKSSANGAAVRNDGELYIAAKSGHDVTFVDASLDSRGKTYIGADLNNDAIDSTGGVTFKSEKGTATLQLLAASDPVTPYTPTYKTEKQWSSLYNEWTETTYFDSYEKRTPAILDNLSVSLNEINGTSAAQSSISGTDVIATNGDLKVSKLTMDTTSSITALGHAITLSNVVIDLSDVQATMVDGVKTYDLSGLLTASTVSLDNLVFDASAITLGEEDQVAVTLGNELTGNARLLTSDGLRNQVSLADGKVKFFGDSPVIPEPATTTLSLLALAGLCARRRRH